MKTRTSPFRFCSKAIEFIGRQIPTGIVFRADAVSPDIRRDRVDASSRSEHRDGAEIFFEIRNIECRGHHADLQIRPARLLQLSRPCQRDVAVEMPLVKFVEEDCGDIAQLRVVDQLAQQNSFGHETNSRFFRDDIFESNLVADFATELNARVRARRVRRASARRAGAAAGSRFARARAIRDRAESVEPASIFPSQSALARSCGNFRAGPLRLHLQVQRSANRSAT